MRRLLLLAWLILFSVMQVRAAEPAQKMILLRRENPAAWSWRYGNLYSYSPDGAPQQLTTLGNITVPSLSPDDKTIAYAAIAESIMSQAKQGKYIFNVDQADPMDIWLMDRETYRFTQIATQPADKPAYRSSPMWSTDSQQLAWFTWDGTSNGGSLEIYDRATNTTKAAASGLMMNANDAGIFNLPNVVGWGEQIAHTVLRTDGKEQNLWLEAIEPAGTVYKQVIAQTDYLPRVMWVQHQGMWWIATQTMEDRWHLIQPKTREVIELASPPLLQLTTGAGVKLKPDSTAWQILTENGETISIPYEGSAAIAPDGQSVVHLRERKVYLWREGQDFTPLLPGAAADWEIITLLWTPMVWVS